MFIFTLTEIIEILIVTGIIGYIFSGFISPPWKKNYGDLLLRYKRRFIDWDDFKYSLLISSPAVILHEMGHKIAALIFHLPAVFNAYWFGLILGIFLKIANAPFLILAPAYVSFPAIQATPIAKMTIAFAGPFVNLMLWLGAKFVLKVWKFNKKITYVLLVTEKLNKWLFLFNMIPVPPLDGFHVFSNLLKLL